MTGAVLAFTLLLAAANGNNDDPKRRRDAGRGRCDRVLQRAHGEWSLPRLGFPCLRIEGAFIATCDHCNGALIVNCPATALTRPPTGAAGSPSPPPAAHSRNGFSSPSASAS
jgi:hypothetical protein